MPVLLQCRALWIADIVLSSANEVDTYCPCTDGPLEFLFVLDSPADPAYGAISAVTKESKGPVARIVVASAASMNSQKIHKCVAGSLVERNT